MTKWLSRIRNVQMAFSTLLSNYAVLLRAGQQKLDISVVTNLIAAAVKILKVPCRSRANLAQIRQSRSDSGLCLSHFSGKRLWTLESCALLARKRPAEGRHFRRHQPDRRRCENPQGQLPSEPFEARKVRILNVGLLICTSNQNLVQL